MLSNGPIIATVALGAFLAVATTIRDYSDSKLLHAVLVLLVLIATSLLTERFIEARKSRKRLAEMTKDIRNIAGLIEGDGPGLDSLVVRRQDLGRLEDRFRGASSISISGGSLARLANEYKHIFEGLVKSGCRVRLLVVDPDHSAAQQLHTSVVYEVGDFNEYKRQIRGTITGLQDIEQSPPGRLEVRLSAFVPPYSLVAVERHDGTATLQVELYPFQLPARNRPTLVIHKERDPTLHHLFTEQFERMWDSELTYPPNSGATPTVH